MGRKAQDSRQPAKLKSRTEVLEDFDRRGLSVAEWSREHELSRHIVYQVLHGKIKGRRGQAHKAAVLLGLKEGIA